MKAIGALSVLSADAGGPFDVAADLSPAARGGDWLHVVLDFDTPTPFFAPAFELFELAFQAGDSARVLSFVFDRFYVLRNQLVHGGATWNSDVNRDQVRDGASLLGCLLPIFVDLMMDNPQHEWPMPNYPVVD